MNTPAKTALGGGLISALAIGGMVTVGVAAGVVADPAPPPAGAATGLTTFEDCDALQAWYVDHTIDQVGPYGWGGQRWTMMREGALAMDSPSAAGSDAAKGAVSNGPTGTNTQEAGVDEPDVAKTDGRIVVRLVNNQRVVITDVAGSSPREIADWHLPTWSYVEGLLLVGDHVLVSGGRQMAVDAMEGWSSKIGGPAGTELIDLDISDPAQPRLESRTRWSGQQLSLRQYGDTVRLVTSTGLPSLPFVVPRPGTLTVNQAEQRNREIVRGSTVEDWVPGVTSVTGSGAGSGTGSGPLVGCNRAYHPKTWSGSDTVAVATFRPGAVDSASAVAVTSAGDQVYSSTDRLYVTSTDWGGQILMDGPQTSTQSDSTLEGGPEGGPEWSRDTLRPMTPTRTHIYTFALAGGDTRYVASGSIKATIRDRWSLDEHEGHLRVAVSWPDRLGGARENGIVVLDERDGRLAQVGELRGLGVDEEIQSVRWFDELAVLVTFRQMDPLYTIDLADPAHPRQLGELKIPGFSSYLHPIGGDRLLGVGTDATTDGQSRGAQVGVFDIGDPTRTRQVGKVTFGEESHLAASDDPHAFTWLPGSDAAITILERWNSQRWDPQGRVDAGPAMVLLRVSPSGAISTEELSSPGGWQPRALPLDGGRVALVGSTVKLVDVPLVD